MARRLRSKRNRSKRHDVFKEPSRRQLRFEPLEDRRLLAVAVVDTTLDVVDLNDGLTSLREAIFAANTVAGADTIEFAPALTASGPATILLEYGELEITEALTISGPGADLLTIDAQQQSRIFNVDDPNVTNENFDTSFSGLTLTRGKTTGSSPSGGAIRSSTLGTLNIDSSVFIGNIATGDHSHGGAIYSRGPLILNNSIVSGNQTSGIGSNGGGIFAQGVATIYYSSISGNEVLGSGAGGGIATQSNLTLNHSTVSGNRTHGDFFSYGGGIWASDNATVIHSVVSGNSTAGTQSGGGGIRVRNNLTIEYSRIEENSTAGGNSPGGGILAGSNLAISRSTISGNSTSGANSSGGGVFAKQNLMLEHSVVSNNETQGGGYGSGGGVFCDDATIQFCTISDNHTSDPQMIVGIARGGGIFAVNDLVIDGTTIEGNSTSSAQDSGGGIYSKNGDVVLSNSRVTGNSTLGILAIGGGIYAYNVAVTDSIVTGNSTVGDFASGGGIASLGRLTLTRSFVGDNSTSGNLARGGGIYAVFNPMFVTDSVVAGNSTAGNSAHGGGVYTRGDVFVTNSTISGNYTKGDGARGGGISASDNTTPEVTISESTISGNSTFGVNGHGGGVYTSGRVAIIDSTISANHAYDQGAVGGGIWTADPVNSSTIYSSLVAGNAAGGGVVDARFGRPSVISFSIVGDSSGTSLVEAPIGSPDANGNLIGGPINGAIDANLGPLAYNGGPVFLDGTKMLTHALLPGSPAIDAGDPAAMAGVGSVPEFDQRGMPFGRIVDGDAVDGARIDIGAYERQEGETYNFVVDTLADESDGDYSAGDFSLREAIELANANPGADTIEFASSLTAGGPATILLTQGELKIADSLTIHGPGADLLTIDASGNDPTPDSTLTDGDDTNDGDGSRVYYIYDGSPTIFDVAIAGLTLTGGDSSAGGAILSFEGLELSGVWITGNSTTSAGGGVHSSDQLTIVDSVISHNESRLQGGGINVFGGSLAVLGSVVSNNTTTDDYGMGAGIAVNNANIVTDPDAYVRIERSVISKNVARGTFAPGGISISGDINSNPIEVTILGSTISENVASGNVAGIYLYGAVATIEDSTVSSNRWKPRAGTSGDPSLLRGGIAVNLSSLAMVRSTVVDNKGLGDSVFPRGNGIQLGGSSTVVLDHSIVARNGNIGGTAAPIDIVSPNSVTALSSLIGAATGVVNGGGSLIGTSQAPIDPLLGPLAYNGGPVFLDGSQMLTHALLPGSPAIDAGDPAAIAGVGDVPEFDQRGMPFGRVANGDDVPEARIDIGAYERQPGETYQLVVDTLVDEDDGDYSAGDFSLREAIAIANANPGSDTIAFADSLTGDGPATILLTQGSLRISDAVTIEGPGANLLSIDASGNDPTPDSTLDDGDDTNDGDGSLVFAIYDNDNATLIAVNIFGLTITGGDGYSGGGISSTESLELSGVVVTGNNALYDGGGIDQGPGSLTIVDSVISHNQSHGKGGGVFVFGGSLAVSGSAVSFNLTLDTFGNGGGIYVDGSYINHDSPYSVDIGNSIITHNSTLGSYANGGGVFVNEAPYKPAIALLVTIAGSTISENTASGGVAGIYLGGAIATIEDSTVSSNRWVFRSGIQGGFEEFLRGGIFLDRSDLALVRSTVADNLGRRTIISPAGNGIHVQLGGTVLLDHSIVARNAWVSGPGDPVDIFSPDTVTARSSLIGAATGIVDGGGNLIGVPGAPVDPKIGPLAYNGGPVFADGTRMLTHVPLPGSPVVDVGVLPVANLKSLYRFEETAGPTVADNVGGFDGSLHGDPALGEPSVIGQLGSAMQFDGVDDYVSIPRTVADDFSFAFWIKTSQASGIWGVVGGDVAGASNDFSVQLLGGRVEFRIGDRQAVSNATVNDGQWHHVAVTRDLASNTRKIYIDGREDVFFYHVDNESVSLTAATELYLGQKLAGDGQFAGLIDEFAVYDRVLNASEVLQLAMPTMPEFDQRGMPWSRVVGERIDIGAVELQANPLPGDYNFDGIVNAADYTVWRNTLGSTNDLRADGSGPVEGVPDGVVDSLDYAFWKASFGNVLSTGGSAASSTAPTESAVRVMSGLASQPPALPGVGLESRYEMFGADRSVIAENPPAEPGADGRVVTAEVSDAQRVDALVAWLESRTAPKSRDEGAITSAAHDESSDAGEFCTAFDRVFDLLGSEG